MKTLLSEIAKELTGDQQKIAEAIEVTKIEDKIVDDLVSQDIVSFEVKDYEDDKKNQNNQ